MQQRNASTGGETIPVASIRCNWSLRRIEATLVHNGWEKGRGSGSDELRVGEDRLLNHKPCQIKGKKIIHLGPFKIIDKIYLGHV